MATVTRTTTWVDGNVLTAAALNAEFNNLLNALSITNADISGGAAIAYGKLALTGSIVNADIASGAAIAYSKLNLASAIQNSDLAGGIAYNKLSVAGSIANSDISPSAAIAYTKLSLAGSIVNADISNSAAIATSKINASFPSGAIVGTTDSQTLSNKTLTKPIVNGSAPALTTDVDGTTITFDMSASNQHTVTLGGNRTLAVSNVSVGQVFLVRLAQDAGAPRVVTWWNTIKWAGGSAPTLTATNNKADTFIFLCTASNAYDGYIVGQNI